MLRVFTAFVVLVFLALVPRAATATPALLTAGTQEHQEHQDGSHSEDHQDQGLQAEGQDHHDDDTHHGEHHAAPAWWSVIPFVLLLVMIATGPLFYEHWWHKNYPKVAVALAAIMVSYYIFVLNNPAGPIHALTEYIPFISLLAALFIASGGIHISVDRQSTPMANITILLIGAIIANLIGTTGASMLLIRPFIRLNRFKIRPYHIVFFIFIVSNVGGSLTPIGDPPLFLGFLKGVPFEWTFEHNIVAWAIATVALCGVFYFFDKRTAEREELMDGPVEYTGKVSIKGGVNFLWLLVVIVFVFVDPNIMDWVPYIYYHGAKISFVKEAVWILVAYLSFKLASKEAIQANQFSFEPIREVAFIFIGIFGTMTPALEMVGNFAKSSAGQELISHNTLYWGTGILSGFLDNAPTYLNFLAAAMASQGADIGNLEQVKAFAEGGVYYDSVLMLKSISIAAVFFGAFTYIGNGPNFMVKSIAEQVGIKMPTFFGYILGYSIPILLPLLLLTWLIFFAFV